MMNVNIEQAQRKSGSTYDQYIEDIWIVWDGRRKLCICEKKEDAEMIKTALEMNNEKL